MGRGERRRAEAAHRQRTLRQVGKQVEVVVRVLAQVVREPGDQQALLERRGRRDLHGLVVEKGTPTSDGAEHLITHRIIDNAELEYAVSLATDGDGEMRQAVGVVGRAVERGDMPAPDCARALAAPPRSPALAGGS